MSEQHDINQNIADSEYAATSVTGNASIHIYNYYYSESSSVKAAYSTDIVDENLPCPYRALFHFRPNDSVYFFGRDAFVEELFAATKTRNFIPVLGASGSGKSSVIFAGLVPKLQEEGYWLFTHFRPSSDPFYALAKSLVPLYTQDLDETGRIIQARKLADSLQSGQPITDVLTIIGSKHPNYRLLLIADQFEELYSLCSDKKTRKLFLDCILAVISSPQSDSSSIVLLIAMRADFLNEALEYPLLADSLRSDIKLIPMNRKELKQVIEEPAKKLDVAFEDGLVKRILDDINSEPGNLPLLEFALTLLWNTRKDKQLTLAAYEGIGRVSGALTSYADEIYKALNDSVKQKKVKQIFLQLITITGGMLTTRRIATKAEFCEENWSLVQHLAASRLVITNQNATGDITVEVVHEALILNWHLLQGWIDENKGKLLLKNKIERLSIEWQENNESKDYLIYGKQLTKVRYFQKDESEYFKLSLLSNKFIKQSIKYSRRKLFKIWIIAIIPFIIATIVIIPLVRQQSYIQAWEIVRNHKKGIPEGMEVLTQGCRQRRYFWWVPKFFSNIIFDKCHNFVGEDLSNTKILGANLSGSDFSFVNFKKTNLSNTNFTQVFAPSADFSDTNLTSVTFNNSYFQYTNFAGADFDDAFLIGTDIASANFKGAKNLSTSQIKQARNWRYACYDPDLSFELGLGRKNPMCEVLNIFWDIPPSKENLPSQPKLRTPN